MLLRARGISKAYGSTRALDDVDFELEAGEIVALAGENGSGKSTLAKIMAGAVTADSGSITIEGREAHFKLPTDALRMGIAIVMQEVTAVQSMSVSENIAMQMGPRAFSVHRPRATIKQALPLMQRVGLDIDPETPFRTLNPGNAVLAEVARGLACEPKLLILDEATSRIGGTDVDRLFGLMRQLARTGMGLVIITHRLAEIGDIADRVVVLRDGHRVGELQHDAATEDTISAMMVGRELDTFDNVQAAQGDERLELRNLGVIGMRAPVTLSVKRGELLGISGLIGSGRSEILETIAGARPAAGGSVLVDGAPVPLGDVRAALEAGIVLLPEDRHKQALVLEARVSANITMGSAHAFSPTSASAERAALAQYAPLVNLRLPRSGDPPVRALSGGNQQKVVFGRAMSRQPKVLLLDEPTRGIDVGARAEIFRLIRTLLSSGTAVVMVSSDMRELLTLSHRIIVMHDREIVGEVDGTSASEEWLARMAGGGQQ